MPLHYKRGSLWGFSWYRVKAAWAHHNGAWRPVKKIFINSGGTWKQVEPGTGLQVYTQTGVTHQLTIPPFVYTIYLSGIGGGGGAGNVVDGGRNDDYGGAGAGGGGEIFLNRAIPVVPGETINITIGAGGGNAYSGRDSNNIGGSGGNTVLTCSSGTYTMRGGGGGHGGVGNAGNLFAGGVSYGTLSYVGAPGSGSGAKGGAGLLYNTSTGDVSIGTGRPGRSYGNGGPYRPELDATEYGGGGAGGYFGYIRQDNGNHPGWGGTGKAGIAVIRW